MAKWTDKPWERQKGESAPAYEAFTAYRDMGAERSLQAVAQKLSKSKQLMSRWSRTWNWQERIRAWDNELEKEARVKAVKDRRAMAERHIGIAIQLQKKALEALSGLAVEDMTEDSHGNYMTEDEIVKACYWYSENGDKVDLQHSFEPLDGATVVENWVAKADFKVGDEEVKKGTWLMTVKVTNGDIWKGIENGEITGLSMGGVGNYSEEDVELETVNKQQKNSERKGLLQQIAKTLGFNVEKGAMSEIYEERSKGTLFWNAMNTLEEVLYRYDNITGRWLYEADEGRVRECLEEFSQIITSILTGGESITKAIQTARPVEKAGKKIFNRLLDHRPTVDDIIEEGEYLNKWPDNSDKDAWYYVDVQEATNSHTCKTFSENGVTRERWTEVLPVPDWTAYEKKWVALNEQAGR